MSALIAEIEVTETRTQPRGVAREFNAREALEDFQGKRQERLNRVAEIEEDMRLQKRLVEIEAIDQEAATTLLNIVIRTMAALDDLRRCA